MPIRIITAGRLRALATDAARLPTLEAELASIRDQLATYRAQHEEDTLLLGKLETSLADAEQELATARKQVLLDHEDRVALRMLLRQARQQLRDRVYVLYRRGRLHSLHFSERGAETAAEAEGAKPGGWIAVAPGAGRPPASEVDWRVEPLRVAP